MDPNNIFGTRMSIRQLGWVNFKVAIMAWAVAVALVAPVKVVGILGTVIIAAWAGITFVGAAVSIVGIILSTRESPKKQTVGASVELTGLSFMSVGPLVYLVTQIGLAINDFPNTDRIALCFFAWAMVCAVLARLVVVIPRFRREAHDPRKSV